MAPKSKEGKQQQLLSKFFKASPSSASSTAEKPKRAREGDDNIHKVEDEEPAPKPSKRASSSSAPSSAPNVKRDGADKRHVAAQKKLDPPPQPGTMHCVQPYSQF